MAEDRGEFSSRLGFVLAATGSAVGLGNVWGFPTNTAGNGGGAFVLIYVVLAFCLAYPALMAELVIGRHTRANIATALASVSAPGWQLPGRLLGGVGILTASAILAFYTLVAGWMVAQLVAHGASLGGAEQTAAWFATGSPGRDLSCALVFALVTVTVVSEGVQTGIERWSRRLMPALIVLLLALSIYVLFQPGALRGLHLYLVPDLARLSDPGLMVNAMGQAFFSLSLGVGTMLIYGSYLSRDEDLPTVGALVTAVDIGVAFLAGLLILPALVVARQAGVEIMSGGELAAGPELIFRVLPALFDSMAAGGDLFAVAFFTLLAIAAVTSAISLLEVPTSLLVETAGLSRRAAAWLAGAAIFAATACLVVWFERLFDLTVSLSTEYSQPLLGIVLCVFAGWVMHRDKLLRELRQGNAAMESTWFWRIWPFYVRFVCPVLIAAVFIQSFL